MALRTLSIPLTPLLVVLFIVGHVDAATDSESLVPVGVAKMEITPDGPIRLSGYGSRTTESEGVDQKLWAKALAIGGDADGPAVLLTVDSIGVPAEVTEAVAERLKDAGIEREQFVVCSTHTHTSPHLRGNLPLLLQPPPTPEQQSNIDRYTDRLIDELERVARSALADRRPGRLAWSRGKVTFAANRRALRDGKWTGFGTHPDGPVDHDLPVLRVTDAGGDLRAVFSSYACHCTTLGDHNRVHGDWAGIAAETMERRRPGVVAMVAIGCGADQNPHPRGTMERVEQHGEALADEIDRLLSERMEPLSDAPTGRFQSIDLPFDAAPSRDELQRRVRAAEAENADGREKRFGRQARAYLEQLDRGEAIRTELPYPVQAWTFSEDLAMVFLAGEVVVDYSLRLKRELDASRLWINAYSNDVPCYIASRRILREGGYEADGSMLYYGQPSRLDPAVEDRIITTVHELLPEGFEAAGEE